MQEPDNFHFYCFEKNAVEVFNRAGVNKVLTKYSKSIVGPRGKLTYFVIILVTLGSLSLLVTFPTLTWP